MASFAQGSGRDPLETLDFLPTEFLLRFHAYHVHLQRTQCPSDFWLIFEWKSTTDYLCLELVKPKPALGQEVGQDDCDREGELRDFLGCIRVEEGNTKFGISNGFSFILLSELFETLGALEVPFDLELMSILLRAAGQCIREPLEGSTQALVRMKLSCRTGQVFKGAISCFSHKD